MTLVYSSTLQVPLPLKLPSLVSRIAMGKPWLGAEVVLGGPGGDHPLATGGRLVPPQAAVVPGGQLTQTTTKRQEPGN